MDIQLYKILSFLLFLFPVLIVCNSHDNSNSSTNGTTTSTNSTNGASSVNNTNNVSNQTGTNSTNNINGSSISIKPELITKDDPMNYFINKHVPIDGSNESEWRQGKATHYGPWNSTAIFSEPGYQPNEIGVGCSNGVPGGDPKWLEILSFGTLTPPNYTQNKDTVWPKVPTVAVSEAIFGGPRKKDACWNLIQIKNRKTGKSVNAVVVDFCPRKGCNWDSRMLGKNVDIYGEYTWNLLGAASNESIMEIDVLWPGILSSGLTIRPFSFILLGLIALFSIHL